MTDVFVPTMMHPSVESPDSVWFRTFAILKPGVSAEPVRQRLRAVFRRFREEQVKSFGGLLSKQAIENYISERMLLEPAATGVSEMQRQYSRPLAVLGVLVALVLLIACANVANLMIAQAVSRSRELALRVSIGAGRFRLVQLVLVESAWLGFVSAAVGVLFAGWAAPFVVSRINPPDRPALLALSADWRVLGFITAAAVGVTVLFALAPALRASAVKPASALKGGDQPRLRSRTMPSLIAIQSTFCFFVLFVAGLFLVTAERLSSQPTGFSAERILNLDTAAQQPQPPAFWDQVVQHLHAVPGVESAALAGWPLMSGASSLNYISASGGAPGPDPAWSLDISPGWLEAMRIPLIRGRDFRADDAYPKVAIVNQAFAKRYFPDQNPLGKSFANGDGNARLEIVGLVADARYTDMRGPIAPTVYVPFRYLDAKGAIRSRLVATLIVRTASPNPLVLASLLRREVPHTRSEFRVSNIRTQEELNQSQTIREQFLALLALFFAAVALLLAAVGLYGVLEYSVHGRRREIAIRLAIGAPAADIARRVTFAVFAMVLAGAAAGLALGLGSARYLGTLLFQVKSTDLSALAIPSLAMLLAALAAALPAVFHAIRTDPADTLRAE
jgi:predicted permease